VSTHEIGAKRSIRSSDIYTGRDHFEFQLPRGWSNNLKYYSSYWNRYEDQDSASHMNVLTSGRKAILTLELWLNKCIIIFYLMKWCQQARVRVPCM